MLSLCMIGFIRAMVPGVNNDGYWNSNYAMIQLENCMDVATVMFPECHHVIYFDHSQGHKAKQKDGLDAAKLNKAFGGKQPMMRDTILDSSCIGQYAGDNTLCDGSTQHCVFREEDEGPFWMQVDERLENKHDRLIPDTVVRRTLRSKKEYMNS